MLLDLLFPKTSLTGKAGDFVTQEEQLQLQGDPVILTDAKLKAMGCPHLQQLIAGARYNKTSLLKKAITRWKYTRVTELDQAFLGLLQSIASQVAVTDDACLCPVPLHWSRKFWRGFNQAEVLSQHLSRLTGMPTRNLLKRVRPTGHQAHRSGSERRTALHGAFRIAPGLTLPTRVILVDDVCTTGSTLEQCGLALCEGGVKQVEAVVLAID